ncbi:hypothetical protein KBX59_12170 [Lentilactobacillus hilgardii]|nr:hypothetical protein [Lentilactobacillus hilgardii]MCP9350705.1 hypothetical protein [Lentilactobacillus hilgardii]MCP9353551.1 hypothetical protein [Lentilactobacillus hilgardii]
MSLILAIIRYTFDHRQVFKNWRDKTMIYTKTGRFICQSLIMIGLLYFFNADGRMRFVFNFNWFNAWLFCSWVSQLFLVNRKTFYLTGQSLPTKGLSELKSERIRKRSPKDEWGFINRRKERLSQWQFMMQLHDDQWGLVINISLSLLYALLGPLIAGLFFLKDRYITSKYPHAQ